MMGTCQEITLEPPDMQNDCPRYLQNSAVTITFSGVGVVLISID